MYILMISHYLSLFRIYSTNRYMSKGGMYKDIYCHTASNRKKLETFWSFPKENS